MHISHWPLHNPPPPAAQNNRCVHFILEPQGRNIIVRNINDENLCAWLLLASNVVTRSQNIIYCRVWTIIHLFKLAPGIIVTAVGLVDWSEGRYPFPRTGFGRGMGSIYARVILKSGSRSRCSSTQKTVLVHIGNSGFCKRAKELVAPNIRLKSDMFAMIANITCHRSRNNDITLHPATRRMSP